MEEIVKYKAFDGKFFDDETECGEYERNALTEKYGISFFDKDFNKISFGLGFSYDFIEDIHYVVIKEPSEGCKVLAEILEYYGICYDYNILNSNSKIYLYDEEAEWITQFESIYDQIEEEYRKMLSVKEKLENVLSD